VKKVVKKKKKVVHRPTTLHKQARGLSKVIILAVVAVVLAGAGGVYVLGQNGMKTAVPFMKPALNPNCQFHDPELCKFMNNFQAQTSYTVTSTSKMGGQSFESVYEIAGEDKFHSRTKQEDKEQSNMISIGDTTYTLDYKDNKWWKMTTKPDDSAVKQVKEMKDEFKTDEKQAEDKTVYKFITKEACGNLTCFKYEILTPESSDTKQYIWFDDSEYLMRKIVVEDKTNGSSESLYTYGNVSISAPSPIKEGNPYER
jgi:outer membrane lipoprotein-sorting protein